LRPSGRKTIPLYKKRWKKELEMKNLVTFVLALTLSIGVANAVNPYTYPGIPDTPGPTDNWDSLDGTWDHNNGSDQWDGTRIGVPGANSPLGGVISLVDPADGTEFLRIQDPYPFDPGAEPSNRKIMFGHQLTGAADTFMDDGVTISFRARISVAPPPPLDNDGNGNPWPANGDGYVIHDGGKGSVGLRQIDGDQAISFSLCHQAEVDGIEGFENVAGDILVMNNLVDLNVGSRSDVDTRDVSAAIIARNYVPLANASAWNTFDITIAAGGVGTHQVSVSVNSIAQGTWDVTSGNGDDYNLNVLMMGQGSTGEMGAIDIDYITIPEPMTLTLLGLGGLALVRRRR
jgi:hypothetical protein